MYRIYNPDAGNYVSSLTFESHEQAIRNFTESLQPGEEIPNYTVENLNDKTDSVSFKDIDWEKYMTPEDWKRHEDSLF